MISFTLAIAVPVRFSGLLSTSGVVVVGVLVVGVVVVVAILLSSETSGIITNCSQSRKPDLVSATAIPSVLPEDSMPSNCVASSVLPEDSMPSNCVASQDFRRLGNSLWAVQGEEPTSSPAQTGKNLPNQEM